MKIKTKPRDTGSFKSISISLEIISKPTSTTVSILIPTYNRAHLWKEWGLLSDLYSQTDLDFELLIVDDNSTDDTIEFLSNYFKANQPRFRPRLIKVFLPKKHQFQTSGVSDNIGFKLVTGKTLIHLDSDMRISHRLVAFSKTLKLDKPPRAYFGCQLFVDKEGNILSEDFRLKSIPPLRDSIRLEGARAWGGVYVISTETIRRLGGHNLDFIYNRGLDARLGRRLELANVGIYFTKRPELTIKHLGLSWFRSLRNSGNEEEIDKYSVSPSRPGSPPIQTIANGGLSYWTSSWFKDIYEEIKL